MGSRRLSFADALELLGVDPPRIAALDRALGGALNLATGGASGTVLGMVSGRGRIVGAGRDAVRGLGGRLGRAAARDERTDVLRAAHTVIVVVAWFEALEEAALPFSVDELELTRDEQTLIATSVSGGASHPNGHWQSLLTVEAPLPTPDIPPEDVPSLLFPYYLVMAETFDHFLDGLALTERIPAGQRAGIRASLIDMAQAAIARYERLYAQLAEQAPEFRLWTTGIEHRATRAQVRLALSGIDTLLARTARTLAPPVDVAAALARAHLADLGHPVLDATSAPEGFEVPALEDMYLDPDFRVAAPGRQGSPADEQWWEQVDVRQDLTHYLAGALTGPALTRAPLLVLGHPGAGKSVLTRVLAARLPAAGFLPVRVPLRDVRAEDELQDQIEQAIRAVTGESTTWPELVRAAGGATPVLLLDGFDELLQTTGVHHTDFLVRVARFQRRESAQGRSVLALVTSRTAVADRARHPEGMTALRLEPFRPEQIQRWLAIWNEANAASAHPLTWEAVDRHRELAEQPLLLTMLALHGATDTGLRGETGEPLAVTELYEELLSTFARREVTKTSPGTVPEHVLEERVEQELQRLSLVAFALLNRSRQWVSADELDGDLVALLGKRVSQDTGFRTPLDAAEVALGRFFFVQRAQSLRDGRVLATYEFLHATFGEYLTVRLTLRLLSDLLPARPSAFSLAESRIDDDLAYALLSYAPLSSRQMMRFAAESVRRMPSAERDRLASRLVEVLRVHGARTADPYPAYAPAAVRTAARHGLYGANLALMIVVLRGRTTAAGLFPEAPDPVAAWHRHCMLWRSSMDEEQWTDFALTFTPRRDWGEDGGRALTIALREGALRAPQPVDANWLFGYPRGHGGEVWQRSYWDELWHKAAVAGATPDAILRLALEPVLGTLGPALTTFVPVDGERATSLAHDLLELLLRDTTELTDDELVALYERAVRGLGRLYHGSHNFDGVVQALLTAHERDKDRLGGRVRAMLRNQLLGSVDRLS
ncbi:NACHT domain-containing protein [Streptomyces sp. NPDC102406]|uniref:NACHT domain-containing protein n=1 Tax=Streptomyces sp. NPDC102406 TaxID=3366171 RepID=UPI00382F43C7